MSLVVKVSEPTNWSTSGQDYNSNYLWSSFYEWKGNLWIQKWI